MSKKSLRSFRVLDGIHTDAAGVEHKKGSIVESTVDLCSLFENKFVEVQTGNVAVLPAAEPAKSAEPVKESEAPKQDEASAEEDDDKDAPLSHPDATGRSELGEDVTKKFPEAVDADLKVFHKGGWHYVTEPDKPGVALNDKGLKKAGVASFIKKFLK